MKIRWLGHACFRFESEGSSLVLDPYEDHRVPGVGTVRAEADAVLCSHGHGDHNAVENIALTGRPCTLSVEVHNCFHDDKAGALRGTNKIHIISDGPVRVAHCGDLGHRPEGALLEALKGLDALLVPVGGYYTMDAAAAHALAEAVQPKVVIPMHYRVDGRFGYAEIGTLDEFLALRTDVVRYEGNEIEITPQSEKQTAVLELVK